MAVKKKTKKKVKEIVREKVLTNAEMIQLDLMGTKTQCGKHEIAIQKVSMIVMERDVEILDLKAKLRRAEVASQQQVLHNITVRVDKLKEDYTKYKNKLAEELQVTTEKWGYNPDTGEVQD